MQDKENTVLFRPLDLSVTAVFLCSVFAGSVDADTPITFESPEEFAGNSHTTPMLPESRYAKKRHDTGVSFHEAPVLVREDDGHAFVLHPPGEFPEHIRVASRLPEGRYARKPREVIQLALTMHPLESKPGQREYVSNFLDASKSLPARNNPNPEGPQPLPWLAQASRSEKAANPATPVMTVKDDKIEMTDIRVIEPQDGAPAQLSLFPSLASLQEVQAQAAKPVQVAKADMVQKPENAASPAAKVPVAEIKKAPKPMQIAVADIARKTENIPPPEQPKAVSQAVAAVAFPSPEEAHESTRKTTVAVPSPHNNPEYYDNFFNVPDSPQAKPAAHGTGMVRSGKPVEADVEAPAAQPVDRNKIVTASLSASPAVIAKNGETATTEDVKIEPMNSDGRAAVLVPDNNGSNPPPMPTLPPPVPVQSQPQLQSQPKSGGLTPQSKAILDALPEEKKAVDEKTEPVDIQHLQKNSLEEDMEVKKHSGIGIKMSVRQPKADVTRMLENAYDALMAGDQPGAIGLYKQVLEVQSSNKLALFGLATTYHRAGQIQLARPLYGKLLAIDPNNVEGLNNFLVLLSDEDPKDALTELGKLEKTHPGFSPIPAQMAVIYERMGDYGTAVTKMNLAIGLSPENLKYRYNMAVILDKKGDWADAAVFYQQLLTAHGRGEKISANPEEIQQRLTFIESNSGKGRESRIE